MSVCHKAILNTHERERKSVNFNFYICWDWGMFGLGSARVDALLLFLLLQNREMHHLCFKKMWPALFLLFGQKVWEQSHVGQSWNQTRATANFCTDWLFHLPFLHSAHSSAADKTLNWRKVRGRTRALSRRPRRAEGHAHQPPSHGPSPRHLPPSVAPHHLI